MNKLDYGTYVLTTYKRNQTDQTLTELGRYVYKDVEAKWMQEEVRELKHTLYDVINYVLVLERVE